MEHSHQPRDFFALSLLKPLLGNNISQDKFFWARLSLQVLSTEDPTSLLVKAKELILVLAEFQWWKIVFSLIKNPFAVSPGYNLFVCFLPKMMCWISWDVWKRCFVTPKIGYNSVTNETATEASWKRESERQTGRWGKNLQGFNSLLFPYITLIFYPIIMFVYNLKSSTRRGKKSEEKKKAV